MKKEELINWIESLEEEANKSNKYFMERNDLFIKNQELEKENKRLKELYQKTCNHLFNIGNDELARYFQAQINECNTFFVGDK